ncbi:hypothetical protein GCM10009592_28790 [Brachybacterium rhamnosum]|uniref:Uncharacterized protein n=1 Tax=Brachybacterium rhamnosum TaxID=173361 RepID=A0ABW4Q279_9MICO
MPYTARDWTDGELVTAEDLDRIEQGLAATTAKADATAATVDGIKLANSSMGTGAPTGTAPVGWYYTDVATGDVYRMEA